MIFWPSKYAAFMLQLFLVSNFKIVKLLKNEKIILINSGNNENMSRQIKAISSKLIIR